MPKGVPWSKGKASLTFQGREQFVGEANIENGKGVLKVERTLPVLPLVDENDQVLHPKPDTKAKLMARLEHEAKRRNQAIPTVPKTPPEMTPGAKARAAAAAAMMAEHVASMN
jgi:hypothetical protein